MSLTIKDKLCLREREANGVTIETDVRNEQVSLLIPDKMAILEKITKEIS